MSVTEMLKPPSPSHSTCITHFLNASVLCIFQNSVGTADEFFLATNPESSGSPPKRAPPPIPTLTSLSSPMVTNPEWCESPTVSPVLRSESFDSAQAQELTVDDIEDFEDDDDPEEVGNFRISRRTVNDAADLVPKLPSFATGNRLENSYVEEVNLMKNTIVTVIPLDNLIILFISYANF